MQNKPSTVPWPCKNFLTLASLAQVGWEYFGCELKELGFPWEHAIGAQLGALCVFHGAADSSSSPLFTNDLRHIKINQ